MATITMDTSEYESMKKVEKLLSASLEKERELQSQIETLNKEKIEALETAKMQVIKKTVTEHHEYPMRLKSDEAVKRELMMYMRNDFDPNRSALYPSYMPGGMNVDWLARMFFSMTESHSIPQVTVTTHGLDEVKAELRAELEANMLDETKSKIEAANKALAEHSKLVANINEITNHRNVLEKDLDALDKLYKQVVNKERSDNNYASITLKEVREALKDGYGRWNKAELLDKVIDIVK